MNKSSTHNTGRYYELDSLRGLAALTVFLSHFLGILFLSDPYKDILTNSILHFFWDGAAAVILFFVLSGFVLALPYVSKEKKQVNLYSFYIKRVLRIYPAYIVALIISVILKLFIYKRAGIEYFTELATMFWSWNIDALTLSAITKHILMIGPKFEMGLIDPIIWSLVVEMKISMIFPIFIPIFRGLKNYYQVLVIVCLPIFVYLLTRNINHPFVNYLREYLVYTPYFLLGGSLAKFHKEIISFIKSLNNFSKVSIGIVAIILYTFRFSIPNNPFNYTITGYIIAIGVVLIILLSLSIEGVSKVLNLKPFRFLGDISYSFYLIHFPIMLSFTSLIYYHYKSIKLSFVISLFLSIALSYILYVGIEKPFIKLGKNLSKRTDRGAKLYEFINVNKKVS